MRGFFVFRPIDCPEAPPCEGLDADYVVGICADPSVGIYADRSVCTKGLLKKPFRNERLLCYCKISSSRSVHCLTLNSVAV